MTAKMYGKEVMNFWMRCKCFIDIWKFLKYRSWLWIKTLMNTFYMKFKLNPMLLCKAFSIAIAHESYIRVLWFKRSYVYQRNIVDWRKWPDTSSFVYSREDDWNLKRMDFLERMAEMKMKEYSVASYWKESIGSFSIFTTIQKCSASISQCWAEIEKTQK